MSKQYWLDVFTTKTWEEFLEHGADVSGFSESSREVAENVKPGDYFFLLPACFASR